MSKKAAKKDSEKRLASSTTGVKQRNYVSTASQMTNTETERTMFLYLYNHYPAESLPHLKVALSEHDGSVSLQITSSTPEVTQHRDVSANLFQYIAKQL